MTSLAAETREAVDAHPFVRDGLRAGVLNFAAAARFLNVDGGEEAVATALRRYTGELPPLASRDGSVRVTMQSKIGMVDTPDRDPILEVGETTFAPGSGDITAIQADGDVDPRYAGIVSMRLANADIAVRGMGLTTESLVVIVDRRAASSALEIVEDAAEGFR